MMPLAAARQLAECQKNEKRAGAGTPTLMTPEEIKLPSTILPPTPDAAEDASLEVARPTFYVSVDPPLIADRGNATAWCCFINLRSSNGEHKVCVSELDMITDSRGFAALAEIDHGLLASGWRRASDWQLGSGRGFVAWLDLDPIGVL